MDNPYAPSDLAAEPAVRRGRQPLWRSLLIAYCVHHVASVLGFILGLFFTADTDFPTVFPIDRPWKGLLTLVVMPISIDVYVLLEPFILRDVAPEAIAGLRWLRTALHVSAAIAIGLYAFRGGRRYVAYMAIVSFLIGLSFAISYSADRMAR